MFCFLWRWLIRLIIFAFLVFSLSCTRYPDKDTEDPRLDHNFRQGTADDLYRTKDLMKRVHIKNWHKPATGKKPQGKLEDSSDKRRDNYRNLYENTSLSPGVFSENSLLKIRTGKTGRKAKVSFAQGNIHIDSQISFLNEYWFLDYTIQEQKTEWQKTLAKLLGRIKDFKGFPETDYYILPKYEGNYYVLYKVGPPEAIPYDEKPIAQSLGKMLAVPLVGYPVEYCVAKVIPDKNYRETGEHLPECEGGSSEQSQYVRLKQDSKQLFEYLDKPDLFPRDFFNKNGRKWFFVRTVVESAKNKYAGHKLFEAANLVEFQPAPGHLNVIDASGYNIKKEDKIRALFIPVKWEDYRIKRISENQMDKSFSEELKQGLLYSELSYFKIEFDKLVKNQFGYQGEKTLKNVVITDDYFSFNIEITAKSQQAHLIKYAFKKYTENPSYVEKRWFEEDSALFFPAFARKRRYHKTALEHTEEEVDKFFRTTRFDPKSEGIRWYFSKQTPEKNTEFQWIRDLGHLAVRLLNKAFQEAGKSSNYSIKVILDKEEAKEVGDIRYNILNLMVTEGGSSSWLFGYGPNVANPITGEIVSATANVWVSNILRAYISIVRRYIRFHVWPPAWKFHPKSKGVTDFLHKKIQIACPEVISFIQAEQKKKESFHPRNSVLDDKEQIKSCATTLAQVKILGTILHEMLHGFASRHVFSSSVDKDNYYKNYKEIQNIFGVDILQSLFKENILIKTSHPPQYSSVMDYPSLQNPILPVPGKLDIAVLRFIYFDQVELSKETQLAQLKDPSKGMCLNGKCFLKVPSGIDEVNSETSQKSILQTAENQNLEKENLKSYRVLCGGKKLTEPTELDSSEPLCQQFDYGATPLEIVENSIVMTSNKMMNRNKRYDSNSPTPPGEGSLFQRQAGSLYKKWEQYRDELFDNLTKSPWDYSFLNQEHICEYKNIIDRKAESNSEFRDYYEIREPVFKFFKYLAFVPAKHCVYKNSEGEYGVASLKSIEEKMSGDYERYPQDSQALFINCQSSLVKIWAEENNKGELITEVGFFGEDRHYFFRPQNEDAIDAYSVFPKEWYHIIRDEASPFSDILTDPEFGARYYKEVQDYVLHGINLHPYINTSKWDMFREENTVCDKKEQENAESFPDKANDLFRFVSYKTDTQITTVAGVDPTGGTWTGRLHMLESAIRLLKKNSNDLDIKQQLQWEFDWSFITLPKLKRTVKLIDKEIGTYKLTHPFLTTAHAEYTPGDKSFTNFIKQHPAAIYNTAGGLEVSIPYADESFIAQLFQKFNDFSQCVTKHDETSDGEQFCHDMEEKRAFIEVVFDKYYTNMPGRGDELLCLPEDMYLNLPPPM